MVPIGRSDVHRVRGVCFSTSARAIVLPEAAVSKAQQRLRSLPDMNAYVPDPADTSAPPQGVMVTPAQKALEEIKRQTGIIARTLQEIDLDQVDVRRLADLNEKYTELAAQNTEMGMWLDMIKTALANHDKGELSPRQFANEVDAAIKGWEGK
jgi:hypothetical protein